MCTAVAFLTCVDAISKYLVHHMDTLEVVWARYTSAFVLALAVSNPITRPGLLMTKRPLLQLARSLFMVGGTVLNVMALRFLQIDRESLDHLLDPVLGRRHGRAIARRMDRLAPLGAPSRSASAACWW